MMKELADLTNYVKDSEIQEDETAILMGLSGKRAACKEGHSITRNTYRSFQITAVQYEY